MSEPLYEKCKHPNLRTFKFKDGTEIELCPAILTVRDSETKKVLWTEQCNHGDEHRRQVLSRGKKLTSMVEATIVE